MEGRVSHGNVLAASSNDYGFKTERLNPWAHDSSSDVLRSVNFLRNQLPFLYIASLDVTVEHADHTFKVSSTILPPVSIPPSGRYPGSPSGDYPGPPPGSSDFVTRGGRRSARHARTRRQRRRRRLFFTVISFLVFCLLIAGGALGYLAYRNGQIARVAVPHLKALSSTVAPMNILLVGNNSRCVLNGKQASAFGSCNQVGGARSDVVMILHVDPATRTAAILSIPRDTFVPIPHTDKANRVDDALNVGPDRLVQTIEDDFGIPINHFVELNFDTFQSVVNILGGVNMYFPDPVKDAYSGLNITTPGCHHLNGFEALALVRARHMYYYTNGTWYYDPTGDLGRIRRDHEFLKVLATQVAHRGLGNPLTDNALLGAVLPHLTVDKSFTITTMLSLLLKFHSISPNAVPTGTLPVYNLGRQQYIYRGANYGNIVLPLQPQDNQAIAQFLGTNATTTSDAAPSSITVSVLNGSGIAGQASQVASQLRALGFDVVGTGNATVVGQTVETTVRYKAGMLPQAKQVESELSGTVVLSADTTSQGADVTVVTGTNLTVAQPASSAQSSSTTQSSSTQSSSSSSGAQLQPFRITPVHKPLPSFDPRACPPGSPVITG